MKNLFGEERKKLYVAYHKASKIFHDKITPKLPANIQAELKKCKTFSYAVLGNTPKVILTVNASEYDITQYWEPIESIFDVYDYE